MKIAYVNQPWNFCPPPEMGSIAIWTYEVARRLAGRHEVIVYARKGPRAVATERRDDVLYRRFSVATDHRVIDTLERMPQRSPLFASRLYYFGYALKVAWDLRARGCDVIHVHNFSQFIPLLRAFNPDSHLVLHMHCEWLSQIDPAKVRSRIARASAVVGCSQYITRKAAERFPDYKGTFMTIYNGADASVAQASTALPAPVLLFVGRVTPEKALHTLIDAFIEVLPEFPSARLRIVGPEAITPREFIVDVVGDDSLAHLGEFYRRSYLEMLRERVPARWHGHIEFAGKVPHAEVSRQYLAADALVNPSFSESFGMTLIEAMMHALPVIASRAGGMPEIVKDGETGYLVDAGDVAGLADAIRRILADPVRRRDMGMAGLERARSLFSWEAVAEASEQLYTDLCLRDELPDTCDTRARP
jgi:glycosyltransferase involved in cell wall biosynthesis